jgi:hypothetical protein
MALKAPGVPSNGTPKSRARGFICADNGADHTTEIASTSIITTLSRKYLRAIVCIHFSYGFFACRTAA